MLFSFFSPSLCAWQSFLSHVRWGALLLCTRVNSLPRMMTLLFPPNEPFFLTKQCQLVSDWTCTRSQPPLFFHNIVMASHHFFNSFSSAHFKAMFLFQWAPNLADMQAAFADVGAIGIHTGMQKRHVHIHTFFHSYTNDSTWLSRQTRTRDTTTENVAPPAGQLGFWIMQSCQRSNSNTIRWQQ